MFSFVTLTIMVCLGVSAFIVGYFHAGNLYDGRKENTPKTFRLLTGLKFSDRMIVLSIVANIIVYFMRNYT